MPIISKIGRRSLKVRLVVALIFLILICGAITMLYPMMLMISGSVKSETDYLNITPLPAYFFDDNMLFRKYTESKYGIRIHLVENSWHENASNFQEIERPRNVDPKLLEHFLAWRKDDPFWHLGHVTLKHAKSMLLENSRGFRKMVSDRFDGDLTAFTKEVDLPLKAWSHLWNPKEGVFRYKPADIGLHKMLRDHAVTRPVRDRILLNPDGKFWRVWLKPKYTRDIKVYNAKHGTNYASYDEVFLTRYPPKNELQLEDWAGFVREELDFDMIRLSPAKLQKHFQAYLKNMYRTIEAYNSKHQGAKQHKSFGDIPLSPTLPKNRMEQVDWGEFIQSDEACPVDGIEVYGPRQMFQKYVAEQRGVPVEQVGQLRMPIPQADWHDCMADTGYFRWEFATRNYKQVLDYIALHGNGVKNTIIFCSLAIALALTVNPMAAYGLSRYKPPSQYKVLLICMATMAFPTAVTMIPAFLLLKRFPLWGILGGVAVFFVTLWILSKGLKKMSENLKLAIALATAAAAGYWLIPVLTGSKHISLLNTFAALVLPGMANGYSIFLLKGFFDSLPRELYEAADLDGASEWTMFWSFTMNLSKPILAVLALSAFTGAYSQFMMALIIIPDQEMWTLMVWIFQLQLRAHETVVYASLVIAAIPTFLIFVFCQGIIMRGIVIPQEK